jgi:hypothetical protein
MPRTFSLQRLMLAITLFCILCGLAVIFPQVTFGSAMLTGPFIPAALVWLGLAAFSRRPWELLFICLSGALIGLILLSLTVTGPPTRGTMWECYCDQLRSTALPSGLGALLLGGAALADDIRRNRQRPPTEN